MSSHVDGSWYGVLAPAGLDPVVARRLQDEVARAVNSEAFAKRLAGLGADAVSQSSPENFIKVMQDDLDKWKGIASELKLT